MTNNIQPSPELQLMIQECADNLATAQSSIMSHFPPDLIEKISKIGLMVSPLSKFVLPNMPIIDAALIPRYVPHLPFKSEPRYSSFYESSDETVVFRIPLDKITVEVI